MRIELTPNELANAYKVAKLKTDDCINRHQRHRDYGRKVTNSYQTNLQGCLGEQALAIYLGVEYHHTGYDPTANDVAGYEVRATRCQTGRLLTHNHDKNGLYVLAIIEQDNLINLAGWSNLKRCNIPSRWDVTLPKPCYAVRQADLWPMDMLPATVLYASAINN
jgi:hypothetical protein